MANFFGQNGGEGDDPLNVVGQLSGALKLGYYLGYICVLPFVILFKLVVIIVNASAARIQARAQSNIPPNPPRPEPPPWTQEQYSPPPPPPPDPMDKYRAILGVPKNANKEQIKKRYRFMSQLCHPDKVADHLKDEAEEEFKRLIEAYRVLYAVAPEAPPRPRQQEKRTEPPPPRPKPREPKPKAPAGTQKKHDSETSAPTRTAPTKPAKDNRVASDDELIEKFSAQARNAKPKYF